MAMAALMDELIEEVLLRLPASEPACLVRAALVCKRWCSAISDAGFRRRFREFHRAPPTIGAVYNAVDGDAYVTRFSPCASSFPPRADRLNSAVLDCRHGRVLLRGMPLVGVDLHNARVSVLDVWDPVTDEQWKVPLPPLYPKKFYEHLVLCAAAATGTCDHLDCQGGPFLVVLVGVDDKHDMFVYTYSSEAAAWSEASSIHLGTELDRPYSMLRPSLVAGDAIYFFHGDGHKIFKYELGGGHALSVIKPPLPSSSHAQGKVVLVEAKDGGLGVANVEGYNIHIWSRQPAAAGPNGVQQWVKDQVIKLDTVVSIATGDASAEFEVLGFGEGTNVIIISANTGIFVVWRNSGRVRKVGQTRVLHADFPENYRVPVFCYQNFYTPALGALPNKGEGPEASNSGACMNY